MPIPIVYLDIASSLLKLGFQFMEKSGATKEQQEEFFNQELAKFKKRNPNDLPDVEGKL